MTRKEAFYSLFPKHDRIIFTFEHDTLDLEEFIQNHLDNDAANDNGGNEIIINPHTEEFDTNALREIAMSLEKQVFAANKTLSGHSFEKQSRQDLEFRVTLNEASMKPEDIFIQTVQRSKWAKFYYDYDEWDSKNRWKTLYIVYYFNFYLDGDFNLTSSDITFLELNETSYQVYPNNEIDVEDMKGKIEDMYKIKKISDDSKERWSIS